MKLNIRNHIALQYPLTELNFSAAKQLAPAPVIQPISAVLLSRHQRRHSSWVPTNRQEYLLPMGWYVEKLDNLCIEFWGIKQTYVSVFQPTFSCFLPTWSWLWSFCSVAETKVKPLASPFFTGLCWHRCLTFAGSDQPTKHSGTLLIWCREMLMPSSFS